MANHKVIRNQLIGISLSTLDGEEGIVKEAVRGDASSFGSLYDHYQPRIYRFILIKVSRKEEAEDLTHQVFLNAWQNIRSYKNRGNPFSSWLYKIARNQVIDYYRTAREESSIEDTNPEFFVTPAVAHTNLDKNLEFEKVLLALRHLEPGYQDVIIMRFVEGFSIKETAKIVNKSEGAVKLIQHRGINKLKAMLS